ncbi:MAG: cysteine desulfurase [Arcanobacterium sp.]|nr:cysteine desulfurase [Arcanobacterium sp.]MDY5589566.1 cysteine desulfurase [Arcanobacterium sp.]
MSSSEGALFNRNDFPILSRTMRGGPQLVYLDSGATAQKPQQVIDAVVRQELQLNGAVARGSHELAEASTVAFEAARANVARFIGAAPDELVWTKNSTEALNEIAYVLGNVSAGRGGSVHAPAELVERLTVRPGDNIVATRVEHHANIIPWQELCLRTGAEFRWLELTDDGRIDVESAAGVIDAHTKVLAFTHLSNVTGAVSPVAELVELGHSVGALVVLDSCQSVPHMPLDVKTLNVDFAVLSGHKMYGPTGIGALYGKRELLAAMPPFLFGGSMIELVQMEGTTYADPPARFEAGSQPVAQAIGLSAAVDYMRSVGMDRVEAYEKELTAYLLPRLLQIPGVRVLGPKDLTNRVGVVAFDVDGVHPHDVGQVLDSAGIAVRVGHHCAQPIHRFYGVFASSRVTLAPYNTRAEIDQFLAALSGVRKFFGLEK